MTLALMWGCSIEEAKDRIPSNELSKWVWFVNKYQFGPNSYTKQFSQYAALSCNYLQQILLSLSGKGKFSKLTPEDFEPIEVPTAKDLRFKIECFAARVNGEHMRRANG